MVLTNHQKKNIASKRVQFVTYHGVSWQGASTRWLTKTKAAKMLLRQPIERSRAPFTVTVPPGFGAIILVHNVPNRGSSVVNFFG